jgi:cardiolipin synthase
MAILPNIITSVRVVLAPFIATFMMEKSFLLAFVCLFIAGVTDWLDGFVARKLCQTSQFGELFDPIADKILILILVFIFFKLSLIPNFLFVIIVLRDVLILVGGYIKFKNKLDINLSPHLTSKMNTSFVLFYFLYVLLSHAFPILRYDILSQIILSCIILMSLLSGFIYGKRFIKALKKR